jgi:hypothetical protein
LNVPIIWFKSCKHTMLLICFLGDTESFCLYLAMKKGTALPGLALESDYDVMIFYWIDLDVGT